jgi:hypothetical protein
MRTVIFVALLGAAACAGPQFAERTRPIAPAAPATGARPEQRSATPIDEQATRAWLDQAIERAPRVEPPVPIVRVERVEHVVERPVYVREPLDPYWHQYDYGGYAYPASRPYDYHRRTTFPAGTVLGAGLGAIIGHQSGHRGRGAWIGGSLGYLFDLGSRW